MTQRTVFFPIQYDVPSIPDMAILIPFFNPAKSVRLLQNLLLVRNSLESAQIPVYIAEIAFNDDPFLVSGSCIRFRSNSVMFYKENLIVSAEKYIPDRFTKLCIMDADILFDNPSWYDTASNTLSKYKVCQPFTIAKLLSVDFTIQNHNVRISSNHPNPGFVWVYDRTWFRNHGIIDICVVGNGDGVHIDRLRDTQTFLSTKIYMKEFPHEKFALQHTEIGSCPLTIYHLYHGNHSNRQYFSRFEMVQNIQRSLSISFLEDAVIRREDNILEWKEEYRAAFNEPFQQYFIGRHDDSV